MTSTTTENAAPVDGWTMSPDKKTLLWVSDPVHLSDGQQGGWRDLVRISRSITRSGGKPVPGILIETADWWADAPAELDAGPDRDTLYTDREDDEDAEDGGVAAYTHAVDWNGVSLPVQGGLAMLVYTLGMHLKPAAWMNVAMKVNDHQLPLYEKEDDEFFNRIWGKSADGDS
jgi:hypothetical protein